MSETQPEPKPRGYRVVLCNTPPDAAETIAQALVAEHLAACVNIIPGVQSVYRWEGKICTDEERTLLIKTTQLRVAALTERIRALHPYSLPEIITLSINPEEGERRYLEWLDAEVAPQREPPGQGPGLTG